MTTSVGTLGDTSTGSAPHVRAHTHKRWNHTTCPKCPRCRDRTDRHRSPSSHPPCLATQHRWAVSGLPLPFTHEQPSHEVEQHQRGNTKRSSEHGPVEEDGCCKVRLDCGWWGQGGVVHRCVSQFQRTTHRTAGRVHPFKPTLTISDGPLTILETNLKVAVLTEPPMHPLHPGGYWVLPAHG